MKRTQSAKGGSVPIRVGLLGCGFIGRIHALNLKADPRVNLVAVADTVPHAAQRLASEVTAQALP